MAFHWSLSDSKFPQVSGTRLSILTDLNNAVDLMVSTCPLISKSTSHFTNSLGIVPSGPITIGITVTFISIVFFLFSSKVEVLISLFAFFYFYSVVSRDMENPLFDRFSFFLLIITRSGCLAEFRRSVCISKFQRGLRISFS